MFFVNSFYIYALFYVTYYLVGISLLRSLVVCFHPVFIEVSIEYLTPCTDTQTDRQTDRNTERQIHAHRHTNVYHSMFDSHLTNMQRLQPATDCQLCVIHISSIFNIHSQLLIVSYVWFTSHEYATSTASYWLSVMCHSHLMNIQHSQPAADCQLLNTSVVMTNDVRPHTLPYCVLTSS